MNMGADGVNAGALHSLGEGAKEAFGELLDALFMWILPILMLVVGYLVAPSFGLSGALGSLFIEIPNINESTAATLASLIGAGVWGAISMGMLAASHKFKSGWGAYILRPLVGFFGGMSISELFGAATGHVQNGMIGNAASALQANVAVQNTGSA